MRTTHDLQRGIHRLLAAPFDIGTATAVPLHAPYRTQDQASAAHRDLYAEYVDVLADAMEIAQDLWEDRVRAREADGMAPDDALSHAYDHFFAGPAACGELIWTLREYWLRCDVLNRALPLEERVPPQMLLFGWVLDEGQDLWVQILTAMPYWPIGVDEDGQWA